MTLGETIRAARLRLGLYQETLAQRLVVDRVTLNRWENDKAVPSFRQVVQLQRMLAIDLRAHFPILDELNQSAEASRSAPLLRQSAARRARQRQGRH